MIDALPEGILKLSHDFTGFVDLGNKVQVEFKDREPITVDLLIGADGINSKVRKQLWGDSPKRHHGIHLMGGWFLTDEEIGTRGVFAHDRSRQGSYTPIRHFGKDGYEWWYIEECEPGKPFMETDIRSYVLERTRHFAEPLPSFIERTPVENTHRWEIIDRAPLKQWSRGRVTLLGDASHPTSPYAAYGAGMSIEDGYFLGKQLNGINANSTGEIRQALQTFEDMRKPHTNKVSQQAYITGKIFHKVPRWLQPLRDWYFDNSKFLQRNQGDAVPRHILAQLDAIEDAPSTAL